MPKDAKITFDGTEYTVPPLNIGQLEKVAEAFEGPRAQVPFAVLRIAFTRATPKVDVDTVPASMDEIGEAVKEILGLAGLQENKANPPVPLTIVKND